MDPAAFRDSPSGTLIPTSNGQQAFLPNPLPPVIDYAALAVPLSRTMQAIGELTAAGRGMTNPMLVIRPLQRREAIMSSAMEGTFTTADQLALAEADTAFPTDASTLEVLNYMRAFNAAEIMRHDLPISNRMIKEIHRILLTQTASGRGGNKKPGEFKDQQNYIGGADRRIENARFIPPPPAQTEMAMAALEKFINREDKQAIPAIIEAALIHYQFEAIHPFADGNGRVGRILIPIHLLNAGILEAPLLYLSPAVEGRRSDYGDLMLDVSRRGEWTAWIAFFLELVELSCRSALSTLAHLEALRNKFRAMLSRSGGSARYVTIVDELFLSPIVTIPKIAELLSITYPAAKNAVARLRELGILAESPSHSNPKRFVCWPIIDVSEDRPETPLPNVDDLDF